MHPHPTRTARRPQIEPAKPIAEAAPTIFIAGELAYTGCSNHTLDPACEGTLLSKVCGDYGLDAQPALCALPMPKPTQCPAKPPLWDRNVPHCGRNATLARVA